MHERRQKRYERRQKRYEKGQNLETEGQNLEIRGQLYPHVLFRHKRTTFLRKTPIHYEITKGDKKNDKKGLHSELVHL